jgi:uncharacterized protein (DUF2147 family)
MRSIIGAAALVGGALLAASSPALAQAGGPTGTWLSQTGETRVRIAPCGGNLCGTIVWLKSPAKDVHNPDESKRGRDLVGTQMITMSPSGANQWSGTLYRYTDGQTFKGNLTLAGPNTLQLQGCGGPFNAICRSQTWSRVN